MWCRNFLLERFISAALFYSTLFASKCQAEDSRGNSWSNDFNFKHDFKNDDFFKGMKTEKDDFFKRAESPFPLWAPVVIFLSFGVVMLIFVYLCRMFCAKIPEFSNVVLVPVSANSRSRVQPSNPGSYPTSAGNNHHAVSNFAYPPALPETSIGSLADDPPAYSIAISQTSPCSQATYPEAPAPGFRLTGILPEVCETQIAHSPPPTYVASAPSFESCETVKTPY